jgi:NAD(P)-dependent dehydrogenase (short-subunit alcohol dehydrogenase family)
VADRQKVAVVTGAAGGLGAAYAKRLAADGFRVAVVDIKAATAVVDAIVSAGGDARAYVCNITDQAQIAELASRIDTELGGADVLVNNAGIYEFSPHETATLALWRKMMALNVDGMFMMVQAFVPGMKAKGWGRIINVASNSCFLPPPGLTAYVASKMAVIGYVQTLAGELGQYGITVNAVAPGPTVTEQLRSGFPDQASFDLFLDSILQTQAIKQVSVPDFSAPTVAFFASDEAGFITGQTLVVDGGAAKH